MGQILRTGASGLPVGSTVRMPGNIAVDSFVDGGATYLRCGVLTPYISPTHDQVAALGFKYSKWADMSNYTGARSSFSTGINGGASGKFPNSASSLYVQGAWGTIKEVTPKLWLFRSVGSTVGQATPIMVREPADTMVTVNNVLQIEPRSAPAWSDALSCWVIAETRDTYFSTNQRFKKVVFLTSKDGVNWMESAKCTLTSGAGADMRSPLDGSNFPLALTCVGFHLLLTVTNVTPNKQEVHAFEMQADRYNVGNYLTNANSVITAVGNAGGINVCSVTKDSALVSWHSGAGPYTPNVYHFHRSGSFAALTGAMNTNTTATDGLTIARNDAEVLLVDTGAAVAYRVPLANGLLTTNVLSAAAALAVHAANAVASGYIKWTGAYWVYSSSAATLYGCSFSANGSAWSSPVSGNTHPYSTAQYVGHAFKNHLIFSTDSGTTWTLWNMASNLTAGTISGGGGWGNAAGCNSAPVAFNGYNVQIHGASMISRADANGIEEVVYSPAANTFQDTTSSAGGSWLKVVNGKIFAINTNAITALLYSSDGATWTSVALPANIGGVVNDVDYIGTKWVIATSGGTAGDAAYTPDLVTLTAVTAGASAATPVNKLVNTGSALIALSTGATGNKRSTDGVTWNTMTGMGNTGTTTAAFYDGSANTYIAYYVSGGTYTLYTSTDGGLNWSNATKNCPCPGYGLSEFTVFNGKTYVRCAGGNESVFTTTDFNVWTQVSTMIPAMAGNTGTYFGRLHVLNNSLRYRVSYDSVIVYDLILDATTGASFVGSDRPIVGDGSAGFMRIS